MFVFLNFAVMLCYKLCSLIAFIMLDGQRTYGKSLLISITNTQWLPSLLLELALVQTFWYIGFDLLFCTSYENDFKYSFFFSFIRIYKVMIIIYF